MNWTKRNGKWVEATLHNSVAGLPAFIVCNGPSLTEVDCKSLTGPGRVVIAVNNAAPKVRPDWWIGMDCPECYDISIFSDPYPKFVHPSYWNEYEQFPNVYTADILKNIPFYDGNEKDGLRWDRDTFRMSIQFAIMLGCQNIFFIGVDLNNSQKDYEDGIYLTEDQRASNSKLYNDSFKFLEWHLKNRPAIGFISSSPNSRINELMPFIPAETVIKRIEKAVPRGRKLLHNSMRDECKIA